MKLKFKLDVEFEEKSPDGRDVRCIVTQEGNKFISNQTAKKDSEKSTEVVREFIGDEMIQKSKVVGSNIVCTQIFAKYPEKSSELEPAQLVKNSTQRFTSIF
jgi:hypothetical protein